MTDDEQAIRDLITTWLREAAAGDLSVLLSLMADDVVFLMPGRPPIRGKDEFAPLHKAAGQQSCGSGPMAPGSSLETRTCWLQSQGRHETLHVAYV